jgi:hypothetical protein
MNAITAGLGADIEPIERGLAEGQARRRAAKANEDDEHDPHIEQMERNARRRDPVDPCSIATNFTDLDWPSE